MDESGIIKQSRLDQLDAQFRYIKNIEHLLEEAGGKLGKS